MGKKPGFTRAQVERATHGMISALQKAGIEFNKVEFDPKSRVIRILKGNGTDVDCETDTNGVSSPLQW
ncbi:hypothetical protein ACW9UR_23275 [Halovulum sp. GXIMD14794]